MKTWILWSENLDTIALYWRVYHTDLPCSKTQWVLWKKKGCVLSRFIAQFWCLLRGSNPLMHSCKHVCILQTYEEWNLIEMLYCMLNDER